MIFRVAGSRQLVHIRYRRWDHIRSAGPLSQIDCAASLAAKRKLGVGDSYGFPADRAAKLESAFANHSAGGKSILPEFKLKIMVPESARQDRNRAPL